MAENLNCGTCWLDMPLICADLIKKCIDMNYDLVAILAIGKKGTIRERAKRKTFNLMVHFVS